MKKILFMSLSALALVLPGRADWLYWTVDFDALQKESPWADPNTTPQVWLVASTDPVSGANGTVIADYYGDTSLQMNKGGIKLDFGTYSDLGDYNSAAYTFFIEMGAISGQADYTTEGISYDSLVTSGFVSSGWTASDGFWNAATLNWSPTHTVPEPTGGLLVVIGAALMALKRKRNN